MPIFYSLVAKGTTVLVEHYEKAGTYKEIARRLLEKLPSTNAKKSYTYESYTFHYQVEDGIVFLCLADAAFGVRLPFFFLHDIHGRFVAKYGTNVDTNVSTQPGKMSQYEAFGRVLQERMVYFSNNASNVDTISKIQSQVAEVKGVMESNIEKMLERGEKIEVLVDKTESLQAQSFDFKRNTTKLKRKMWWQNTKFCIVLSILLLLVLGGVTVGVLYYKGLIHPKI
eukprot:TRINITY_DN2855_c0_g2_i1.p1 TRINITY_DN2855_c0_g2~~TRINITY_DN2855_c0_g2_i1.p1  ORF type:complete len:226 (-),score=39.09 TRINITY_DN2855_c0_g2_i1:300-977(-)